MKVFHLEYSDFFRKIVGDMIQRGGYDYVDSRFASDLISSLQEEKIDLIISGYELGDMEFPQLVDLLKEEGFGDIPIVLLTSMEILEIRTKIKGVRFNEYLLKKDLSFEKLIMTVDRFMN